MTEQILYTSDFEDAIKQDADISAGTREEALAEFRRQYDDSGFRVTGIEEAAFGDCWVKLYGDCPETDDEGYTYFDRHGFNGEGSGIQCFVRRPSQHPGGAGYWIEPMDSVYVPVLEEIE